MIKKYTLMAGMLLGALGNVAMADVAAPTDEKVIRVTGPTLAWWCYCSEAGVGPLSKVEFLDVVKKNGASIDLPPHSLLPELKEGGHKVSCIGLEVGNHPPFTLSPGNPKEAEEVIASITKAIDAASKNEVPMVLVFTGNKAVDMTSQEQFDGLVAAFKKLAKYAGEKNVQLVLECLNDNRYLGSHGPMKGHPGYLGSDPWFCLDLVKAVDNKKWFGLATDWYHLGVEDYDFGIGNAQDMSVYMKAAKPHIMHTHVAGIYDNKVLMRGPLHLAGQKLDFGRIYKEFGCEVSYCLENPIFGGAEDKVAAEEAVAGAIRVVEGK